MIKYSKEKVLGLMLGTFCGDALGCPLEGGYPDSEENIERFLSSLKAPLLYTDDTQMAISVFEEMASNGHIDKESLKDRFLKRFDYTFGYGSGVVGLIDQWKAGVDVDTAAREQFRGEGSYGNGAAMRVAPVSLFYTLDETEKMFAEVRASAEVTHTHILGVQGAQLQAYVVLLALNDIPEIEWFTLISNLPLVQKYQEIINEIEDCFINSVENDEAIERLGNGIEAFTAVPAAIYSYLCNIESFHDIIIGALSLGGDADTIGAMAGAIAGARLGVKAIPGAWLDKLYNEKEGMDFIIDLVNSTLIR